jgi:hypothetical protein
MTSTVIGKLDYDGDTARIEGDSVPTRKIIAKVAAFLKARPLKGKDVVAQIIEEGDKAGWIEHVQELPLDEKMKKAGFGQPTPVNETAVIGTFKNINKFNQIGIENRKGIRVIGVSPDLLAREKENFAANTGMPVTVMVVNHIVTDLKWTGPGPQAQPCQAPVPTAKEILEKNIKDAEPPAPVAEKKDVWGEERKQFIDLLTGTKREGIENLLNYLEKETDFYIAPSSTKYHDACAGGLLHHSVKVYHNLVALSQMFEIEIPADTSLAIIALLHDLCKTNIYKQERKSLPRRDEKTGELVLDDWGKKIWDEQIVYTIDDQMPLGHGEKSVIMIQRYIQLSDTEIFAIRWHMMAYDDSRNSYAGNLAITNASDKFRIIPLFHMADLAASFLERRGSEEINTEQEGA